MERKLLFISRSVLQKDQKDLRDHMDHLNHTMPDITLQWRALGQVGIMMVQSHEYEALTQTHRSRLRNQRVDQVAHQFNNGFLQGYERTVATLDAATFLGNRKRDYSHVGFWLAPQSSGELERERTEITAALDRANGTPGEWRDTFRAYLSLATIPKIMADDKVLTAFQDIMPESVTLYEPLARTA